MVNKISKVLNKETKNNLTKIQSVNISYVPTHKRSFIMISSISFENSRILIMPVIFPFNNAFEYILDSNFSLIKPYRKPTPIFEPDKNIYDFKVHEKYNSSAIQIVPPNTTCLLFDRYKRSLEHCGFRVYTSFEGFQEIRNLYF